MASIFFFQGSKPCGVNQYPSQLVSLPTHTHIYGLMKKPVSISFSLCRIVVSNSMCCFQSLEKTSTTAMYASASSIPHNTLSRIASAMSGEFESHRESHEFVLAKWCDDHTEIFTFLIMFKCIVLYTNIKFGEKLTS